MFPSMYDDMDSGMNPPLSTGSDFNNGSSFSGAKSIDQDEVKDEMNRLTLELKQTMELYSTVCKEAIAANQKLLELQRWKVEEERSLEESRLAQEKAMAMAERAKANYIVASEEVEAARADLEARKIMANGSLDDCLFRRGNKRDLSRQQSLH